MEPDIADLNSPQRQALLDLLVLAQYLDRHLESGEDTRVKRLLLAMGCDTPYDRQRLFDAAVNRVRPYAESSALARTHAAKLARAFTTQDQCRRVIAILEDLILCDGHTAPEEKAFLDVLRDVFQV
jgi:hypothetical protein